jgi:hypothetical protein
LNENDCFFLTCSTNAQRVGAADIPSNLKRIFTADYSYFTKKFICQVVIGFLS